MPNQKTKIPKATPSVHQALRLYRRLLLNNTMNRPFRIRRHIRIHAALMIRIESLTEQETASYYDGARRMRLEVSHGL